MSELMSLCDHAYDRAKFKHMEFIMLDQGRSERGLDRPFPEYKMPCTVGFVNSFLRVPLMYQPCCLLPCCQGKVGELPEKKVCPSSMYKLICFT